MPLHAPQATPLGEGSVIAGRRFVSTMGMHRYFHSPNDLPMLAYADVSLAYRAKPVVRAKTTYAIDYCGLDAALNLFS